MKPDPFVEATADSCVTDIAEVLEMRLANLRVRLDLSDEQYVDLITTVALICQETMIRTGEMVKDSGVVPERSRVDTLENG